MQQGLSHTLLVGALIHERSLSGCDFVWQYCVFLAVFFVEGEQNFGSLPASMSVTYVHVADFSMSCELGAQSWTLILWERLYLLNV